MTSNLDDPPQIEVVREDLINTAVKFLINPNVQKSPIENREAFLRKKGLSEKEIQLAFERSSVNPVTSHQYELTAAPHIPPPPYGYMLQQPSQWTRFREFANTVAVIGSILYGLYHLYRKYILPFFFGPSKKLSPLEDSIAKLDASVKTSVQGINVTLEKVQQNIEKLNEQQASSQKNVSSKELKDVKSEIASLKGLLLNRKQFPTTTETPLPLSIPTWQLEESTEKATSVSNNGSDSSVETIQA